MIYIFAEDKKISGKWIQLISRNMVSLPVHDRQTDLLQPSASRKVSVLDRQTDLNNIYIYIIVLYNSLNDIFLSRRYKNIRKMDSTYITKYGYNEPISQRVSYSVCLPLTDRLTSERH